MWLPLLLLLLLLLLMMMMMTRAAVVSLVCLRLRLQVCTTM